MERVDDGYPGAVFVHGYKVEGWVYFPCKPFNITNAVLAKSINPRYNLFPLLVSAISVE